MARWSAGWAEPCSWRNSREAQTVEVKTVVAGFAEKHVLLPVREQTYVTWVIGERCRKL